MTETSPLRILHVVCTDAFAGVERHIATLAADQAARGHEVHVVGGDPETVTTMIGNPNVTHVPARTVAQARAAIRRLPRPSVVNAHMTAAEVATVTSPRLRQVPIVSTRHFAHRRGARRLTRPLVRLAARGITAQIAVSRYVADHIDGPSIVIHSGVPTRGDVTPLTAREPVVLMAQRLEPEKATDTGILAFAASALPSHGWRLQIAGDGHLRESLHLLASQYGVRDAVDFLGHRGDVDTLMRSVSILLAPRPDEGYGLTVLEAMAVGTPVVAAAGGGHLETVGCLPDAALFQPGDVAGAARLLDRLADDAASRRTYGTRLQDLQQRCFTVAAQSSATEAVYRSVL